MPVDMIDRDGNVVQVADQAEALSRFNAGELGFDGGQVPVTTADGEYGTVPVEQIQDFVASGAGQMVDQASWDEGIRVQEIRDSVQDQSFRAGVEGAVQGLGAGFGDFATAAAIATATGRDTREILEEIDIRRQENATGQIGEIVGSIAPALLSGGSSMAARLGAEGAEAGAKALARRGAGVAAQALRQSPSGMAARGTRVLGEALEAALPEASSTLGKAARAAASAALEGGADAALYGVGQQLKDDAIGRDPMTMESFGTKLAQDFLLGAAFGGAAGASGVGTKAALRSVAKKTQEFEPWLRKKVAEASHSAFHPLKKHGRALRLKGMTEQEIGETVQRYKLLEIGDGAEDMAHKVTQTRERVGQAIGDAINKVDEMAAGAATVDAPGLQKKLRGLVDGLAEGKTGSARRFARSLEREIDPILQRLDDVANPVTLGELHSYQKAIDDVVYRGQLTMPQIGTIKNELQNARRIISGEVDSSIERMAQKAGDTKLIEDFRTARKDYARLSYLKKVADDALDSGVKKENWFQARGLLAGTILGDVLDSAGADMGLLGSMALLTGVGKFFPILNEGREKMLAIGGEKLLTAIQKGGEEATRRRMTLAADAASGLARRTATATRRAVQISRFDDVVKDVQSDESQGTEEIAALQRFHPVTGAAASAQHMRASSFLRSKLPPQVTGKRWAWEKARVAPADKERFMRYAQAVADPDGILEDFAAGRADLESMEVLREVYPAMHTELVNQVNKTLSEADKPPSYEDRVRLSVLLGVPIEESMMPEAQQVLQGAMAMTEAENQARERATINQGQAAAIKSAAEDTKTETQKLME